MRWKRGEDIQYLKWDHTYRLWFHVKSELQQHSVEITESYCSVKSTFLLNNYDFINHKLVWRNIFCVAAYFLFFHTASKITVLKLQEWNWDYFPFLDKMTFSHFQLWEIITPMIESTEKYTAEKIMEQYGVKCLRLPPYHPELNPM